MFSAGAQRLRRLTFFCSLFIEFATSAVIVRNATNGQPEVLIRPAALENREELTFFAFTSIGTFTSTLAITFDTTEIVDNTKTVIHPLTAFETTTFVRDFPTTTTFTIGDTVDSVSSTVTFTTTLTFIDTSVRDLTETLDNTGIVIHHFTELRTSLLELPRTTTLAPKVAVGSLTRTSPVPIRTSDAPKSSSVTVQASDSQTAPSTPIPTSSSESSSSGSSAPIPTSSSESNLPGIASSSRGTTRQKRTAIALGVTLGLLFPLLVVLAFYLLLRRRRRAAVMRNDATSAAHRPGSDNNLDLESGVNRSSWMSTSSGHALLPPNGILPAPKPSPALGPRSKKGKLYITNQVESAWEKVVELRRMTITLLRPSSVSSTRKSGSSWTAPPLGDGPVTVSGGAESPAGAMDTDKMALAMREIEGLNSRIRELEALGGASIATSSIGALDELAPPVYAE